MRDAVKTVDGAGSGLDADLLDGIQGANFLRSDTSDTMSGNLTLNGRLIGGLGAATTSGTTDWNHSTNARSGNGYTLLLGSHTNGPAVSGYYHPVNYEYNSKDGTGNMSQFAIPYSGTDMFLRTRYSGSWTGWSKFWNSGNDGSGSGLDADLLDGQHGSYYYPASNPNGYTNDQTAAEILTKVKTVDGSGSGLDADLLDGQQGSYYSPAHSHPYLGSTAKAADSELLDGVNGASYLRSDTADTFGYLSGTQITLGTGAKLRESSHRPDLLLIEGQGGSWAGIQIDNTAAETIWNIMADGTTCGLYDDTSNQWSWQANDGGGINLNYNGAQKIVTTNTGVSVTGNIGVSGTVDGRDIATDGTKLNTIETGATADQSAAQIKAHLVNGIDSTHYVDGSIDRVHLAADVIDSTKLANDSVNSEHYVSNSIDALHLNVSGNGTTSQYLRSDGDGTMSWVTPPDTNTDTNTTYSADGNYGMTLSGTAFRLEDDRRRNSTTTDVYSGNTHDYTFYDASHGIRWYTAGAEEMRLEDDGDLHVDGSVTAYSATVSDERLKTDIVTLENAVDKIKQIRGVEFTRIKDGKRSAGVIAQELEVVLPQAITEKALPFEADTETLYKTVDYDQIHGLLIEAIKEQQVQIDELKEMIKCQ
jgi:hypothetical protein